jgi:hypothetical protein
MWIFLWLGLTLSLVVTIIVVAACMAAGRVRLHKERPVSGSLQGSLRNTPHVTRSLADVRLSYFT